MCCLLNISNYYVQNRISAHQIFQNDEEYFRDRFNAFSYSDTALGQFIKKAKTEEYYKDTLFIIPFLFSMSKGL